MEWASWLPKRFTPSRNRACSSLDQNLPPTHPPVSAAAPRERATGRVGHLACAILRACGAPLPSGGHAPSGRFADPSRDDVVPAGRALL